MTILLNKATQRLPLKINLLLHKVNGDVLVLLVLPWLLLLINQTWIFTPIRTIDPWLYWGYFNNFGNFLGVFSGTYYGTRLPWIVPGYICYKIFPPLVANYVLHVGFYYVAVFSLYYNLKITGCNRSALFTSILLGCYTFFLAAIGTDYIDGAGITYLLLTLLLLNAAARSLHQAVWTFSVQRSRENIVALTNIPLRTVFLLFLAGASLAAFVYTNTFLILFVPIIALYYILLNHENQKYSLIYSLLLTLFGFITCTVVLCVISAAAGGSFFFFLPSIYYVLNTLGQANPWFITGYAWLKSASWLVIPSFLFLGCIVFIVYTWLKHATRTKAVLITSAFIFSLCYVLIFIIMLVNQIRGNPVFQLTYYASYMLPFMFLAIGVQSKTLMEKMSRRQFGWLIVCLIVFMILPYFKSFYKLLGSNLGILYPVVIIIIAISYMIMLRLRTKFINLFTVALLSLILGAVSFTISGSNIHVDFVSQKYPKQLFLAVSKSDAIIKKYDSNVEVRFWYSKDEPQAALYCAIASTRLWAPRLINDLFPTLESYELRPGSLAKANVRAGSKIVIISSEEDVLEKANDSLEKLGLHSRIIGVEKVEEGTVEFSLTFIEVESG